MRTSLRNGGSSISINLGNQEKVRKGFADQQTEKENKPVVSSGKILADMKTAAQSRSLCRVASHL